MNRIDMHPEELLHSARQGTLSADETARLGQHLSSCAACHVEFGAMDALAQEMGAQAGDDALVARMVRQVAGEETRKPRAGDVRRRVAVQMAAAGVIVGLIGGAAAAYWSLAKPSEDAADTAAPPRSTTSAQSTAPARSETSPVDEAPGPVVPQVEAPAEPQPTEAPALAPTPAAETAPSLQIESAGALLARAGRERRSGEHARAARTYQMLQGRHPSSREALLSHVSLGQLLLGPMADSPGALRQFDAYLDGASGGVLSEEARVGKALALERMGRTAGARAAWADVLERHPGSPNAARARAHLAP